MNLWKTNINMKNKAIFLDRDGTINKDFGYISKLEQIELLSGVPEALKIFQEAGYKLIVITNQSGVGRGYFSQNDVYMVNQRLKELLSLVGVSITDFYICFHSPADNCNCRKPSPLLIKQAVSNYQIDVKLSFMFGDKDSDVVAGEKAGVKSYIITDKENLLFWANKLFNDNLL